MEVTSIISAFLPKLSNFPRVLGCGPAAVFAMKNQISQPCDQGDTWLGAENKLVNMKASPTGRSRCVHVQQIPLFMV
jgi:hypothetical protein